MWLNTYISRILFTFCIKKKYNCLRCRKIKPRCCRLIYPPGANSIHRILHIAYMCYGNIFKENLGCCMVVYPLLQTRLSSLQMHNNHVHDRRRTTQICIPIRTQNVRFDVSRKMITVNVETTECFYIFYFTRVPYPKHETQTQRIVRVLYIIIIGMYLYLHHTVVVFGGAHYCFVQSPKIFCYYLFCV